MDMKTQNLQTTLCTITILTLNRKFITYTIDLENFKRKYLI